MVTVSVDRVVPKPPQLSWEQAGSIMLTGTTAISGNSRAPGPDRSDSCGSRRRGSSAVPLAALDGISVIGTASEKDFDLLR